MNVPVRGKLDKEPPLPACARSGIISSTNVFFAVPPGARELSHGALGQWVPTEWPPSLAALCPQSLALAHPTESSAQAASDGAGAPRVLGGLSLTYSPADSNHTRAPAMLQTSTPGTMPQKPPPGRSPCNLNKCWGTVSLRII